MLADVRSLAGERLQALDDSQLLWADYRDVFCYAHGLSSGSTQGLNTFACMTALTTQRSRDICDWILPNSELDAVADPPETCREFRS